MIMKNKMISFQNDVFSKNAENHRLKARIKDLEAKNTLNAKNRNNTSSAFTLPSEFKTCWEELVKVLILDAFPDFMDKYKLLVPLAQEILILLIQAIKTQRDEKLSCIGDLLNIHGDEDGMNHLDVKTKALFQEYSLKIFQFDDEFYQNLVFNQYMPICKEIIDGYEDDDDEDYLELLDEAVNSDDFKNFVKSLHKIVLHISLSDPPISLDLVSHSERVKKTEIFDMYEFKKFKKTEMFCIDGFPKEDLPSVIVYPPPMKGKYVYQGIKPSVITLPEAEEDIVEYVKNLKEAEKPSKKKSGKQEEKKETERKQENSEILKEKDNPKVGVVEEKQLDSKSKKEKLDKNEVDEDSCFKCGNDPSISKQSKEPSICNSKRAWEKTNPLKTDTNEDLKNSGKSSKNIENDVPKREEPKKAHESNLAELCPVVCDVTQSEKDTSSLATPRPIPSVKKTEGNTFKRNQKPVDERVVSPVPKDLTKVASTDITLKNEKTKVLEREIESFKQFKEEIDQNFQVEGGSTRFADLATKSITKIDSQKIVKSPTNWDSLKRIKVLKNSSQTIDPGDLKKSDYRRNNCLIESSSNKEIQYSNIDKMKLEQSIHRLKESMKAIEPIRNFKTSEDAICDISKQPEREDNLSGKIWQNKVNNFHLNDGPSLPAKSDKLGDNTAEIDTERFYGKITNKVEYTRFGISTYRGNKSSSFKDDSGDDTLERASNPDVEHTQAINSSRTKNNPTLNLNNGDMVQNSGKKTVYYKDRNLFKSPFYWITNGYNSREQDIDKKQVQSQRGEKGFMDKIKSNNDKPYQTKDYFSFASPNKEYDKENGNTGNTGVKNNYPDSQLHPQFSYSSKTKVNKQKERNLRKEYIKQELNKSFRSGLKKDKSVDNSSKGEINASTSNDNDKNPLITESLFAERNDKWNEKAKHLGKEISSYSSREMMEKNKQDVQEKLKLLVKTVKRNSFIQTDESDSSYVYKKKRGSSLQRFQEQEKQKVVDEIYQRRSYNNNLNQVGTDTKTSSKDSRGKNLAINTILKDKIHKGKKFTNSKRNNNEMPLQKLRMKQKSSYLKTNFVKTSEEIKANIKDKITDYQHVLKKNFIKKSQSERESRERNDMKHFKATDIPPKYSMASSSTLSTGVIKRIDFEKRNRFGNIKNVATYNRIGSKSPAGRKKAAEGYKTKQINKRNLNNIIRHPPKVFEVDQEVKNHDHLQNYANRKPKLYEARRSNLDVSSSSDSSMSIGTNKHALNIRRTIKNHQRSRDSSFSSSRSNEIYKGDRRFYNVY